MADNDYELIEDDSDDIIEDVIADEDEPDDTEPDYSNTTDTSSVPTTSAVELNEEIESETYPIDDSPNMGEAGEDIVNVVDDPVIDTRQPRYKIVTSYVEIFLNEFSSQIATQYMNQNAALFALFDDGTTQEVTWADFFDPTSNRFTRGRSEAELAAAVADQHFWDDDNGIHVTDSERADWVSEYAKTNHGTLSTPTTQNPWFNILMNSLGILQRTGTILLSSMTRSGVLFYDGTGNTDSNVMASFGINGSQIGKSSTEHIELDSQGLNVKDGSNVSQAFFGSTARVGPENSDHIVIDSHGLSAYDSEGNHALINSIDVDELSADTAKIHNLTANQLSAATAYIAALTADSVTAASLTADIAKIHNLTANQLSAATAYIASLTSNSVTANSLVADIAKIHGLTADQLSAATAYIASLVSGSVAANDILADHAAVGNLDANYAQIDLANVNNTWITNGIISDASISDAKIIGVSANKLTAGTIDASNITVTNLNASNITAGTLNGQRIGTGSLSLDKLADDVYTEDEIDTIVAGLNGRIDAQIETWTSTSVPTLNNYPASSWTNNNSKSEHVGDICYVINSSSQADGYTYRFAYDNSTSTYGWILIKDNQVTAALQRLLDAEGDISSLETFQSNTESWISQTDTDISSLQSNYTSLNTALGNKVETSTFNTLSQSVSSNSASITQLTTDIQDLNDDLSDLNGTVTTVSNSVNTVTQTANSNSSVISNLTSRLSTNADGTAKTNDIVNQVSSLSQTLTGFQSTVSETYATKTNLSAETNKRKAIYATSTTAIATAAKVATCSNFELYSGVTISVKFNNGNSNSAPTLNVNSTGAKSIKSFTGGNLTAGEYTWPSNAILDFMYDGTYWRLLDGGSINRIAQAESSISQNANGLSDLNGTVSTLSSNVNTITQTANSNSSVISNLTSRLSTNADGTANANDIVNQVSSVSQTLSGFQSNVSETYATKTELTTETNKRKAVYATSTTAIGTAAKVATCSNFELYSGVIVSVKFSNGNNNTSPTLNINSTGAKSIKSFTGGNLAAGEYTWPSNAILDFMYDGTNWRLLDGGTINRIALAETSITQNTNAITLKANVSDTYTKTATDALLEVKANKDTLTSEINASADTVKINANRLNITGVIEAVNNDTTTLIDGGKIQTSSLVIGNSTLPTVLNGINDSLDNTLIYDHTYTISNGVATFVAKVYNKGIDVTSNYTDAEFSWSYREDTDISGTPSVVSLGTGKTKSIDISSLGYGGRVIGTFTPATS